ncbi:Transcription initiation factor IIF subunit beta [Candida viswanathii]|uniref:Transcription initiation factor IIF subunit beta n=1 Tax=Candida viswanathii TaxID=5486 RepID=A0A367YNE2_9ASCO|nr:Transcription initiation factor IIF subunit beta [Candida viswanathii]
MSSIKSGSAKPSPVRRAQLRNRQSQPRRMISRNIKPDNFDDEPSILSDPEDYLEGNESLDMNLSRGDQKVWLVKLPRYLMDVWSNKETMNGQQLGNVKIRKDNKGKLQVKLVLNEDSSDKIPHDYDIKMLNTQVNNSYAFTEENLKNSSKN